jgi:hypothetical protein
MILQLQMNKTSLQRCRNHLRAVADVEAHDQGANLSE